ncbi:MAG: methyltransferase domain-containing protein [Burkholderiales bacterium]
MNPRFAGAVSLLCAAMLALPAGVTRAQEPRVPYVPTPQVVVDRMLQMAKVGANDYLIDLGSGDGRIVVTAAKQYGARGFGVDINPTRVAEALDNAQKRGVTDKAAFYQRDLFQTDLSQATVITMYLLPRVNMELRPKLLDLKPGTRIVSHDFSMDDWKPDAFVKLDVKEKYGGAPGQSDVYFWVVPAKVAGNWRWELPLRGKTQAYAVALNQTFQQVTGSANVNGRTSALQNIKLLGDEISFSFTADLGAGPVKHEFRGKVDGESVTGSAALSGSRTQGQYDWSAARGQSKLGQVN